MLLDEPTLRKLNQLTLLSARVRSGVLKGERRSSRRGSSVEFADYRDYTPGDDLRRLDWNIYARLERPFIKLLEEEEDLAVHLLLDGSKSMDWPPEADSPTHKFRYAQRLAAGLGVIALAAGDALTVGLLQNGQVAATFGPARGQTALPRLFDFLETLQPQGETRLEAALQAYFLTPRRPGLVVLISDLFDPNHQAALRALRRHPQSVLLHLLSPDELEPPLSGDLQLLDIETGNSQDVSLDGGLRALYRQRIQDWRAAIQTACRQQGTRCLALLTERPWDEILLLEMRKAGVVK